MVLDQYPGVAAQNGTGTFNILYMQALGSVMPSNNAGSAVLCFRAGLCDQVPMFPFTPWLPDATVEAPTSVSVILAGMPAEDRNLLDFLVSTFRCSRRLLLMSLFRFVWRAQRHGFLAIV